jgi:hypothetical protein
MARVFSLERVKWLLRVWQKLPLRAAKKSPGQPQSHRLKEFLHVLTKMAQIRVFGFLPNLSESRKQRNSSKIPSVD